MPLKVRNKSGEAVFAFNYDPISWKELKERNRSDGGLVMPCCGRPVTLKTSHLGTRFFAHTRREGSACSSESEEHILAKDLIARAVVQAGWNADTEALLKPHGLVADVLASKGTKHVAFEVQWSRQKWEDTQRRHAAYTKAGIRTVWLFKQWDYPRCREIPAFRLVRDAERNSFLVWVWRGGHDYERVNTPSQAVELQEFVSGSLVGRLKWMPAAGLTVPMVAHLATYKCICGQVTPAITELELDINRILAGHSNPKLTLISFTEFPEPLRTAKMRNLLKAHGVALCSGVNKFEDRWGNYEFQRQIDNCCAKCGELIWRHLSMEQKSETRFETPLVLSDTVLQKIHGLNEQVEQWWFELPPEFRLPTVSG